MPSHNYPEEILQTTPQAAGLLFHALKDGNSTYHISVACRLQAQVSHTQICTTWQQIQMAQPALRSVFAWHGLRHPHQLIYPAARITLDYQELHAAQPDSTTPQPGAQALAWLADSRSRPFALNREVFRIACFHDVERGIIDLAFSFHHILMDGWSSSLLISQWIQGLRGQLPGTLEAHQYAQQMWQDLDPVAQQKSLTWWKNAFAGLTEAGAASSTLLLAEPLFRNLDQSKQAGHAAEEGGSAAKCISQWQRQRKHAVESLCRQAGVTPATFFYLCWAMTLARLTWSRHVVFGCAFSGREAALARNGERQPLGLFTNTVPLIIGLEASWNTHTALQAVFKIVQQTQQYEKTPPLTVRAAAGERGELYDTLVVFDNYPIDADLQNPSQGPHLQALHSEESTHFGLTLTVSGIEDWRVELISGGQSKPQAMQTVLAAFEAQATDLLAASAHQPISELAMRLAPDATPAAPLAGPLNLQVPDINTVLAGISERLLRQPEAVSLIDLARPIRNHELVSGINALQTRLRQAGFLAGERVAVHIDKGLLSTQAILAILFGGGSYVYLNPKDPLQRKQTLLALSSCNLVLDAAGLELDPAPPGLPHFAGRLLQIDASSVASPASPAQSGTPWLAPLATRAPADECYFIFTSGTTGTPKGIPIRNESVANLLDWFVRDTGLNPDDRVLGLTDLNFDPSVEDLLGSLVSGATLIYPAAQVLQEKTPFLTLMQCEAISVVNFIPGAITQLLRDAPPLPAMRLWILGGEELPRRLRDTLLAQGHAVRNHYGPSETTVDCLCAPQSSEQAVAIGWPVQNALAYCSDVFGQPLPDGIRGELRIGGMPVAKGYATNAQESRRCFIEHAGEHFYRTGDAVLLTPDLGFSYLGRLDDQAKVNGVRIEPRELERVVELLEPVRIACLLPVTSTDTDVGNDSRNHSNNIDSNNRSGNGIRRHWHLFIDSASAPSALLPQLREHIRRHLPETWVPARITVLDGLDRTSTGKIDRPRLLALARQMRRAELMAQAEQSGTASEDPQIAQIQAIWRDVLESGMVPVDMNFFDAGGDSLKIIALQSQLQTAFGRDIGVTVLFEHPTIAAFSTWLSRTGAGADGLSPHAATATPQQREQQLSAARSGKNRLAGRRQKAKESSAE
jgi:amino acid adenylation domain-containing protein